MFIAIIIIILGACMSVVVSMYYNTITMLKSYGTVNWYYWAYYWAMASIERWLLMSKIKYPTYQWMWWFKWGTWIGAPSNAFSWDFWKLTQWNNSMVWYVDSKTTGIVWTIDTKTLRSISFEKYSDDQPNLFTSWTKNGKYWITDWLTFSWSIYPISPNLDPSSLNTDIWKSSDFNRFFSLNKTGYIVRWLKTTEDFNRRTEWEKDYQLTWNFDFTGWSTNPWPALSWQHKK